MKKVLLTASVPSMISQFNRDNLLILRRMGYQVHVACNFKDYSVWGKSKIEDFQKELDERGIICYHVDFSRSTVSISAHRQAYRQMKEIMIKETFEFLHCHTPVASAICRVCAKKAGIRVIYTAHGFHFYTGAPITNWFFYPIEKYLSRYTDILITINKEDYERAKKKFHAKSVKYIPSVGIHIDNFEHVEIERDMLREQLGIPEKGIVLMSVGELSKRKNHKVVLKALTRLNRKDLYYIICGKGYLKNSLEQLIKKNKLDKQVKLLGYRDDIAKLYSISDICVLPSKREGFGIAAIEGMACGLPLIASGINGIKDYARNNVTGFCLSPRDVKGYMRAIQVLADNKNLRVRYGAYNKKEVKKFDIKNINSEMHTIYEGMENSIQINKRTNE